jgi:hypothetical protein
MVQGAVGSLVYWEVVIRRNPVLFGASSEICRLVGKWISPTALWLLHLLPVDNCGTRAMFVDSRTRIRLT